MMIDLYCREQQQRFFVRPMESSILCAVSIPYNSNSHRDTLLYGDDEGFVGLLTIDANDLSNNKNNLSQKTTDITLDPNKLSRSDHQGSTLLHVVSTEVEVIIL